MAGRPTVASHEGGTTARRDSGDYVHVNHAKVGFKTRNSGLGALARNCAETLVTLHAGGVKFILQPLIRAF
jgi:hypothetical protein